MRIIRDLRHFPDDDKNAVVALGNFDGVHRGHQAILQRCIDLAKASGVPSAVMTFEPHPREFFARDKESLRICSLRRKLQLFAQAGIDAVFLVRFNGAFASLSASAFVKEILLDRLQARHVVTGSDFAFGRGREGNTGFLAASAQKYGFGFTACSPVLDENAQPISSSAIRKYLAAGDMQKAALLLGRPYDIEGHVRHGEKRGRKLGFPTANLSLHRLFKPRFGIYAVRLAVDGQWQDGVANLGIRPMFKAAQPLLEVHGFDLDRDIYGQRLRVQLLDYLREEKEFSDAQALSRQIASDCAQAKSLLQKKQNR